MAIEFDVGIWIGTSILSSTSLILCLKQASKSLCCSFIYTLSSIHFLFTWGALELFRLQGKIKKNETLPQSKQWILASLVLTSIISMNFNLKTNSVGFYQMSKLVCIPYMIIYNFLFKSQKYSLQALLSLATLLFGVGLFSISDVELNFLGVIYALIAIVSTAHNQMFTGEYQKEFGINGPELQLLTAPKQLIIGSVCSLVLEFLGPKNIFKNEWTLWNLLFLFGTCLFAIGVNVSTFQLIGRTSSITYQVVGHFKTILLLVFGFIFFPTPWESTFSMIRAYAGVVIALVGVFWYSAVKDDKPSQKPASLAPDETPLMSAEEA